MPLILALDTTSESGGIALIEGNTLLEDLPLEAPQGHGHIVFGEIERLLYRHGKSLAEIDCFAASAGPGSFTGVRIGLAAVKGLAEVTGRPVAAVSNLKALAWSGSAPLRATVLDARRGDVFAALYDAGLVAVLDETVTDFAAWIQLLPEGVIEFVSPDFGPYRPLLAGTRFEAAGIVKSPRSVAASIAHIASRMYTDGILEDPLSVDANYVRISDAERMWKDRIG